MSQTNSGARLPPEVLAFVRGHYQLAADAEALKQVEQGGAHEAVAFYAGRILEVLTAQALEDVALEPHQTVLANLDILEQYSLMPLHTRYCAHALRRLANDARHILRRIQPADARLARFFVEQWIEWYFRQFAFGPKLAARDDAGVDPLGAFLGSCQTIDPQRAIGDFQDQALRQSPVLPAIATEAFLNCGRVEAARDMVAWGLGQFGGDGRLTMLEGLVLSRMGELRAALGVLEPLFSRFSNDPEAAGILAGVYKRLWEKEPANGVWLKRSFDTYHAGWMASRQCSDYLGTNAATTALWLGRLEQSRAISTTMRDRIAGRMNKIILADPLAAMDYWAGASLGELELLSGDVEGARRTYGRLFGLHAEKQGNIAVSRHQAELIFKAMGGAGALF